MLSAFDSIVPGRVPRADRARSSVAAPSAVAALALLLCACSCEDAERWRAATYISPAEAAAAPACEAETRAAVAATAEASGANVDPNLVEIARLEVERDCYKSAEESLRQRLQGSPSLK